MGVLYPGEISRVQLTPSLRRKSEHINIITTWLTLERHEDNKERTTQPTPARTPHLLPLV